MSNPRLRRRLALAPVAYCLATSNAARAANLAVTGAVCRDQASLLIRCITFRQEPHLELKFEARASRGPSRRPYTCVFSLAFRNMPSALRKALIPLPLGKTG